MLKCSYTAGKNSRLTFHITTGSKTNALILWETCLLERKGVEDREMGWGGHFVVWMV